LATANKEHSFYQNEMKRLYMFTDVTFDDIYAVKEGSPHFR